MFCCFENLLGFAFSSLLELKLNCFIRSSQSFKQIRFFRNHLMICHSKWQIQEFSSCQMFCQSLHSLSCFAFWQRLLWWCPCNQRQTSAHFSFLHFAPALRSWKLSGVTQALRKLQAEPSHSILMTSIVITLICIYSLSLVLFPCYPSPQPSIFSCISNSH